MDHKPNPDYIRNLALASVAGQAGCMTVVLVFAALFAGIFLDNRLDTRPAFTLGLILLSVPVSLFAMIRLMLSSVGAIKFASPFEPPRVSSKPSRDPAENSLTKENGS